MKEVQTHELTREQLTELAEMISDKVIKHQDNKHKRLKDNAYHNTRLLLRNYDKLKKHCQIVDEQTNEYITYGHFVLAIWHEHGILQDKVKILDVAKQKFNDTAKEIETK